MKLQFIYNIKPVIPKKLEKLVELAKNIRWAWNHESIELFRQMDKDLWEDSQHNPYKMLGMMKQEVLDELAQDEAFLAQYRRVLEDYELYMSKATYFDKKYKDFKGAKIAYFSAEFGLTECIPNYSGGLGVLAGDYLKSASDLGFPLIGVGLLYQQGYFIQSLTVDGWQQEHYPVNDFYSMPIYEETDKDGNPIIIEVEYPGSLVKAKVWRIQIGRIPLYLLDTNIPGNSKEHQDITDQLYGGDVETRIMQEIMLGIGGAIMLRKLGINPLVYHMNEGHSAFLILERVRQIMEEHKISFDSALTYVKATNIFTTHTPVPAGIDVFPVEMIDKYFSNYYQALKINRERILKLGRLNPLNYSEPFNMAIFALRCSAMANGVSKLHGEVSRKMWSGVWPNLPINEIPITSVTNGIHLSSWISMEVGELYDRYLSPKWNEELKDEKFWKKVEEIPAEELWRTHERRRERLVAFTRRRVKRQLLQKGARQCDIEIADEILNPSALTIVFARRFATYKRATLILKNLDRLNKIINNKEKPVQIIFAGKAHPRDNAGKELIKQIIQISKREEFYRSIVFIENYDMCVARYLVGGADVWLNTPRRPYEASGTSGMKVVPNGGINLSELDGWWAEGYLPSAGWAIGGKEEYINDDYQDEVESNSLYDILEKEVVPLFYERGNDNLPRKWISVMKSSIASYSQFFNTNRMICEYFDNLYKPSITKGNTLRENKFKKAIELATWKEKVFANWEKIKIDDIKIEGEVNYQINEKMKISCNLYLDTLMPEDVKVEIYSGMIDSKGEICSPEIIEMEMKKKISDSKYSYFATIHFTRSGQQGLTIRILPKNENLFNPYELFLIKWA